MTKIKKKLATALTFALCAFPLNTALVFAETTTEATQVEQTTVEQTSVGTEVTGSVEVVESPGTTESTEVTVTPEVTDTTDGTATVEVTEPVAGTETPDSTVTDETGTTSETDLPPVLDENGEEVLPGTTPDSPFYWLETLIEKLQVALTFDPVEKTQLLEEQALERLAEADALIEEGETEQAEETLQSYSVKVTEAQAFLTELTAEDSETAAKLETALSQTHAKNIETLGGLLDKLPPQAAQKVALNVVRSMEKSIAKMEKKDQKRLAKELKNATEDLTESELNEEDQAALETLDKVIEGSEEEVAVATEDTEQTTEAAQALTANALTMTTLAAPLTTTETSQVSKAKKETGERKITEPQEEAKAKTEQKPQESKHVDSQIKAEQEKAQKEQQKDAQQTEPKEKKEQSKADKSGGKGR